MPVTIDPDLCPQHHECPLVAICPVDAFLQPGGEGLPVVDAEICIECGLCVESCGESAVRLE